MNVDVTLKVEIELGAQTLALIAQARPRAQHRDDPNNYGSGAMSAQDATQAPEPGNNVVDMPTKPEPAKRGRKPKETPAPNITAAPEAREEPEQEAEGEPEPGEAAKSHDDVRNALTFYGERYGMNSAMEDGPRVLELRFGKGVTKVSQIPDTQEALGQVLADIAEMTDRNPFKRSANV